MTIKQFNETCANFARFANAEVSFKAFIPSSGKYSKRKGILLGIGTEYFSEHLIIGWKGQLAAIHFSNIKAL